jgi:hypothetical protein
VGLHWKKIITMSDDCRHWTTPRWLQTIYERFCKPFTAWVAVAIDGTTPAPLNLTADGNLMTNITNFPSTQPISGSVSVSNFPSTQAVSGTVTANTGLSQPLTDTQLRASAVPVSGTFYQATQPVSLASVPSHPVTIVNGANTLAVDSAGAVTVNNPASATYTNTVSGAISGGTIFLGPIDCSQFRQIMFQAPTMGTGMQFIPEISLDGTNYTVATYYSVPAAAPIIGAFSTGSYSGNTFIAPLYGARFWRLRVSTGASAGTTTVVAYANQSSGYAPTSSSVTGSFSPAIGSAPQNFHTLVSSASTNATSVTNGATNIQTLVLSNTTLTWKYFKLFNKASAPTVGTDTPIWNIGIPPNSTIDVSNTFAGNRLLSGIAYAITGGSALLDTTAVSAGDVLVNLSRS